MFVLLKTSKKEDNKINQHTRYTGEGLSSQNFKYNICRV